jgi:4-hydroxythreonine-4-phosphate dehydrogenase
LISGRRRFMGRGTVRLALTIGDPGGIGPEICAKLLAGTAKREGTELVLIGAASALFERDPSLAVRVLPPGGDVTGSPAIIDVGGRKRIPVGRPTAEGGAISARSIEEAVSLAKKGSVDGIVTGPISKEALHMAGVPYIGHTEMLAALFDAPDCQMMMVAGDFRVVILTRHVPLRAVAASLNRERIVTAVRVTRDALRGHFGIEEPRIAVASLNPHGSDGGLVGTEERDVIEPALMGLRAEGMRIEGPHPADSLFHRYANTGYDVAIALYHDQGMIPFKMAAFDRGVNVTIGLPVIRTSVCHGTAFDIAGRGEADARSLEEAVALAASCVARNRNRGSKE